MNYTTKRNIAFSICIAVASIGIAVGLYYLIQAANGSPLLTITDSDAPVFSYIGATFGISVAIVASLSTIFLALQAMGIAREQALMSAREAYIDDIREFKADAHEAERLLLEVTDKSLQHARAVRDFMIHRLPDYSHFAEYETEIGLALALGEGAVNSALLSSPGDVEGRVRQAVNDIYNECKSAFPIEGIDEGYDETDEGYDYIEWDESLRKNIRKHILTAAVLNLGEREDRDLFITKIKSEIRKEAEYLISQRNEGEVNKSKAALLDATANAVEFLLSRNRSFMFAELLEINLSNFDVETGLRRITDLLGFDKTFLTRPSSGIDRLRYLVTAANSPSVVWEHDLRPNEIEIPTRSDGRLGENLRFANLFLPRLFAYDSNFEYNCFRPHAAIEYLPDHREDRKKSVLEHLGQTLKLHPVMKSEANYEYFSFVIMLLQRLMDLHGARAAIEAHLRSTGTPPDLAHAASKSYARTIRPSAATKISRHEPKTVGAK
jgi:hypothetical protein